MNDGPREMPDFSSGCKLTLVAVAAAFFVAALGTPIDWMPTSAPEPASEMAPASETLREATPVDAVAEPPVQGY